MTREEALTLKKGDKVWVTECDGKRYRGKVLNVRVDRHNQPDYLSIKVSYNNHTLFVADPERLERR